MTIGPNSRPPQTEGVSGLREGSPLILSVPGSKHEAGASLRPGALQYRGCSPWEQVCLVDVPGKPCGQVEPQGVAWTPG